MKLTRKILAVSLSLALGWTTGCGQGNVFDFTDTLTSKGLATEITTASVTGAVLKIDTVQSSASQTSSSTAFASNVPVVILNSSGEEVAKTTTNEKGQYVFSNLLVSLGEVDVKVASEEAKKIKLQPGKVHDMGLTRVTNTTSVVSTNRQTITGVLVDASNSPIIGAIVRDKEFKELQTTTNGSGSFSLEILSEEVEVVSGGQTRVLRVADILARGRLSVDISANTRTIKGFVKDSSNPSILIPSVPVKIAGTSLTATSRSDGSFEIFGAPLASFTIETTGDVEGYSRSVSAVGSGEIGSVVSQDLAMEPIGSIIIHMTAENAPFNPSGVNCLQGFNCSHFDINGNGVQDSGELLYDNSLSSTNGLSGIITVSGTKINQEFSYPATPTAVVKDASGDDVIGTRSLSNVVFSVPINNIPGGKRTITISLTGHQTQKSLSVFIPAKDRISTELITLRRAREVDSLGDIKGKVLGVAPADIPNVRVNFLDLTKSQAINALENQTDLLSRITASLTTGEGTAQPQALDDTDGNYLLTNVPSGSRIVVTSVIKEGALDPCYIPSQSSLINVVGGTTNQVPALNLIRRTSKAGCQ